MSLYLHAASRAVKSLGNPAFQQYNRKFSTEAGNSGSQWNKHVAKGIQIAGGFVAGWIGSTGYFLTLKTILNKNLSQVDKIDELANQVNQLKGQITEQNKLAARERYVLEERNRQMLQYLKNLEPVKTPIMYGIE